MIPNIPTPKIKEVVQPSKTYDINNTGIKIDGVDAVKLTVYFILNTERYKYLIYSWNYGIELHDLIGKHKGFVYPELERRINEALMQDDRIKSISAFSFNSKGDKVLVSFTVNTIYGGFEEEVLIDV